VRAPDWLTARPIAHRGLHDHARGIIENMPAAAQAAVSGNFSIECDIQLSADGEAMVHHDDALGRLTEGSGALLGMTSGQLRAVKFKDTSERMMSLGDLCALVDGRVPLVIEVKSHFDGDRRLVTRMSEVLASYSGPVAECRSTRISCWRCAKRCRPFPRHHASATMMTDYWKKRRRSSAKACCIFVTPSAPGRISWPIGSTIYRPPRPGSPATSSAAAADLDRAHAGAARTGSSPCRSDDF
jgi:glycerophosphoryl diester phosphodiesterase